MDRRVEGSGNWRVGRKGDERVREGRRRVGKELDIATSVHGIGLRATGSDEVFPGTKSNKCTKRWSVNWSFKRRRNGGRGNKGGGGRSSNHDFDLLISLKNSMVLKRRSANSLPATLPGS